MTARHGGEPGVSAPHGGEPGVSAPPRVRVLSRRGCHLCDDAIAVVAQVCAETGDSWVVDDVDTDPELARLYTEQVPVIFVDGAQHDYWRVDPGRLLRALRA